MTKTIKQKQKTNLLCKFVFIVCIFFTWTSFANAQIVITEIMYNPEGSDEGREWVEIYNNGTEPIDLTRWKLLENDKNHNISLIDGEVGNFLIPSDRHAVIIVNKKEISNFYNDNPNFSGILFYSAFYSLNNSNQLLDLVKIAAFGRFSVLHNQIS